MSDATETKPSERDPRELDFPYEFPLRTVIETLDGRTKVLVLQAPTGADVIQFGLLEGLDAVQFKPLVCKLADITTANFDKLDARDVLRLGTVLSRFFVWAAQPPAPSTTPSS